MINYEISVSGLYRLKSDKKLSEEEIQEIVNSDLGMSLEAVEIDSINEEN